MKIIFIVSLILTALTCIHEPYKIQIIHDLGSLIFSVALGSGVWLLLTHEEATRER